MDRVWLGMPADSLPSPEDLTLDEIDTILDPHATGVPELSPLLTSRQMITKWEQRVSECEGEERLIAIAELARHLGQVDPVQAKTLADEVLAGAPEHNWLRAQAEGLRAYARLPGFMLGLDSEEQANQILTAIELFDALHLDIRKAELMLVDSTGFLIRGGMKRAAAQIWEARQLARHPQSGEEELLRHTVLSFAALGFAQIAWRSDRDYGLTRRYAALSMLHARASESPAYAGVVHVAVGGFLSDQADFPGAKEHHLRAARIFRHHEAWNACFMGMQRATYKLVQMNDLDAARKSLSSLKKMRDDKSLHDNVFSVQIVEGYLRLREEQWAEAISLLEPLLGLSALNRDTRLDILRNLSGAYQKSGKIEQALEMLQKAIRIQEQHYEDRLQGQARQFRLTDELAELKARSERDDSLLKAILPPSAYDDLTRNGHCDAQYFENVAVFFSDFAGFTKIAAGIPPRQLMEALGEIYDRFDRIMSNHGCERIEVIGDAYLAVAGLSPAEDSVTRMAAAALEIAGYLRERNRRDGSLGGPEFVARIGLHTGSIIGGLVGGERIRYAIFGDAVNTAQRLEAGGTPGEITASEEVATILQNSPDISLDRRADINAKGKGALAAWVVSKVSDS